MSNSGSTAHRVNAIPAVNVVAPVADGNQGAELPDKQVARSQLILIELGHAVGIEFAKCILGSAGCMYAYYWWNGWLRNQSHSLFGNTQSTGAAKSTANIGLIQNRSLLLPSVASNAVRGSGKEKRPVLFGVALAPLVRRCGVRGRRRTFAAAAFCVSAPHNCHKLQA